MTKREILIAILILFTLPLYSQEVDISNIVVMKQWKNLVTISFDVTTKSVLTNEKLTATPILYNGKNEKQLTLIVISGRKKRITDNRAGIKSVGIQSNSKQTISYTSTIPYESWMSEVSLKINRTIDNCCNYKTLPPQTIFTKKQIKYNITPTFNTTPVDTTLSTLQKFDKSAQYLYPTKDYEKRYQIFDEQRDKGALIVYFEQGASTIDPNYKNNYLALAQVNEVLEMIKSDPNASLKKIVIVGLASPEGKLEKNDIIAKERANSMKQFIGERVNHDTTQFELINGSEDWNGLKRLVEQSKMTSRSEVLNIIDKYSITDGREKRLMDLSGGRPYIYMMKNFFPQLRNAGYIQIYYDYNTPNINADYLNSALQLMQDDDYDNALRMLYSINEQDHRILNLLGVCQMMLNRFDQAEKYFNLSILLGDVDALENIQQINKVKKRL